MQATIEQVINFVITNGEQAEVSMADVQFVGIDTVLAGIQDQLDRNLKANTNIDEAMWDYFCDGAFSVAYDRAYAA